MAGMLRWRRVFVSLMVTGLLASSWATCVAGATANTTEQMACCKAGHDQCPMKDSASDCCKQSAVRVESEGTIVKAASLSAPAPVPTMWMTLATIASAAQSQTRVSYEASPPGLLLAPPAYIAFSALLI